MHTVIALTEAEGLVIQWDGVIDTHSVSLLYGRLTGSCRGLRILGEGGRDLRTGLVVDLDGQQAQTGPLVSEGEVDPFLVDLHRPDLCVDDDLAVVLKPSLVGRDPVYQFVRLWLPGRGLMGGGVELVEEEGEGLLALHRPTREQVARPNGKLQNKDYYENVYKT